MTRRSAQGALLLAFATGVLGWYIRIARPLAQFVSVDGDPVDPFVANLLLAVTLALVVFGVYRLVTAALVGRITKRRANDLRNVLRLVFGAVALVAVFGALTEQWLGVLFSLGVVGFAITFALQQPILSLLGWLYLLVKRPFGVGDRVRIGDVKGDVVEVDFLVTTIWEVGGELVSTNQPSGRRITVPNSVVLSEPLVTFGGGGVDYVWNELALQVAYETDLAFAREVMADEADQYLGEEMQNRVRRYRSRLERTAVELSVDDRPSVNVVLTESWVELRLRYLVDPRKATRTRNILYERILARLNDHPEKVQFPVGRNR